METITGVTGAGVADRAASLQRRTVYGLQWTVEKLRVSRTFDLLVVLIVFFAVVAGFHIHFMLTVGDWDFWVDWKDRQYWLTATPVLAITFPAALQQVTWERFRLPIGATVCMVALSFGIWMSRYFGFHLWSEFPISLVWPATLIPSALVLDMVLLLTGSWLITSVVGGMAFALLFWPANWVMLAAYHPPIEVMGNLASVADYIGYAFTRTATPEYLRFIERGTLRTFGGHSAVVSAFFAGFLCTMTYLLWWFFGKWLSRAVSVPNRMKGYMGM